MKQLITLLFILTVVFGCSVLSGGTTEYAIDPVCGMKVDKAEAYVWKYKEVTYYFDSYACKETFKMNPEKVLNNDCVSPSDTMMRNTMHQH